MSGSDIDVGRFVDAMVGIALDVGCVAVEVTNGRLIVAEGDHQEETATESATGKLRMVCARLAVVFGAGTRGLYGGRLQGKQRTGEKEAIIELDFQNDTAPRFRLCVL